MKLDIPKFSTYLFVCILFLSLHNNKVWGQCTATDIGGTVYQEFNMNGQADLETATRYAEPVLANVGVTIYDMDGTVIGTTTSDVNGEWWINITTASGDSVQVVFDIPTGYTSGPHGANNNTSVQYATIGNCGIDFTVAIPEQHCEDSPSLALVCFNNSNGDAEDVIVIINYDDTQDYTYQQDTYPPGVYPTPYVQATKTTVATQGEVEGAGWIAWNSRNQMLYSGVYHKWELQANIGQMGKLFVTDLSGGTPTSSLWLDLNTVFAPGVAGTYTGTDAAVDVGNVGYIGFTDIEISDDNNMLFVYNAFDRSVYVIPINTNGSADAANIKVFPIPDICAGNHAWGPPLTAAGGLGYYNGRIYATATCTGPNVADLRGRLFSFDPTGTPATTTIQTELDIDYSQWSLAPVRICGGLCCCNSDVNNNLVPWSPTHQSGNGSDVAPWMFDIVFDEHVNGDVGVSIGTRNRAMETVDSDNNPDPTPGGYISRGCFDGTSWSIESGGSCGSFVTGLDATAAPGPSAADNIFNRGQPDATFYHGEGLEGPALNGALETIISFKEVVGTATDNVYGDYDSGIMFHSLTNGLRTRDANLLQGSTVEFAKGISWGDIEAICEPAPLEIGNLVWHDDGDGRQEPNELGIAGITVNIYEDTNGDGIINPGENTPIATTTTDANGNYYFSSQNDNIQYNTNYIISIDNPADYTSSAPLENGLPTTENINTNTTDAIDSDGLDIGTGFPQVAFNTGGPGHNDHTYDFGFLYCPSLDVNLSASNICLDETFDLTLSFSADTVNYTIYYQLAGNWLTAQEVYSQNGVMPLIASFTPASGTTDSTFTAQVLPPNTSDSLQTYYLYMVYEDSTQIPPDCPLLMTTTQIEVYPQTPEATLTPDGKVCLGKQAENSHIIDLNTLITAGSTSGYWNDDDATGGLVGSVFTASATGTFNFTYTIAGMPGAAVDSSCSDNTYTISIEVRQNCCPQINSVITASGICTGETEAGTVDITIDHAADPENLALYYSTNANLTATDLYGTPHGGGATAINTTLVPTGSSTTESGVNFPANTTNDTITYTIYALLAEGNSNIDTDCMPFVTTTINIYPLPPVSDANLDACDKNDGTGDFDLASLNSTIDVEGDNAVTYHPTQADADAGTNALILPHNDVDGATVYARIENAEGCYRTATINLTLLSAPVLEDSSIEECDSGDGSTEFDLSGINFYYANLTDAESEINPLAANYLSSGEIIYIRVNSTNGCYTIRQITLVVLPLPNVANAELPACDSGDGTATYTLSDANPTLDLDSGNTVTYHNNQLNALQGINAVANTFVGSGGEQFWARVEDDKGCFRIAELTLVLHPLPNIAPAQVEACNNGDDTADFILTDADATTDVDGGNTVTYHANQADANANVNALSSPYTSAATDIHVRVTDANGCYRTETLSLSILPLPPVANADLFGCDDGDGTVDFTLTNADPSVDVDGGNTITYHPTMADAQANTNALTSPYSSGNATIYARVLGANGCFDVASLNLIIVTPPTASDYEILACDNGDGTADFDLATAAPNIDTNGGNTVTYHPTMADADANTNAFTNPYNSTDGTIYARVTDIHGCYSTATITLSVQTSPILTDTVLEDCDNGDGTAEFDLTGAGITYYPTLADAETETNPLGSSYAGTDGEVIYSRVNATNGCYVIAQVTLVVEPIPTALAISVNGCDDGTGGTSITLSDMDLLVNPDGEVVSYHTNQLDAFNNANPMSSPHAITGSETIYSRVESSAGCVGYGDVQLAVVPNPEATAAALSVCDNGDGTADFDLSSLDVSVDLTGSNTVTYHANQADADANLNPLSSPYNSAGGMIYARVTTVDNCYNTSEITLSILPLPIVQNTSSEVCDEGNDGIENFDLNQFDVTVDVDGGNTISYHISNADALANTNALSSPYATSDTTIYARIEDTNACFDIAEISLVIHPTPEVAPAELELCDLSSDNTEVFDLNSLIPTVDVTGGNTVTFHSSQTDADTGNAPLPSPYNSASDTIYARVINNFNCYNVAEVTLTLLPLPSVANAQLELCDGGDGTADFDLTSLDASVDLDGGNTVTYHANQADADANLNALNNPYNSAGGVIYARVTTSDDCYDTSEITLTVLPLPAVQNTSSEICDEGDDGTESFDLSLFDAIVDVNGGNIISYHASNADAAANINALNTPYATAGTTIFARIENANGCFDIAEVLLTVHPTPEVTSAELELCDLNNDNTEAFDLNSLTTAVDVTGGNTVTFHSSQADADTGNAPLPSPYNAGSGMVYARVANAFNCYAISEITLILHPMPNIADAQLQSCDNGDGTADFLLSFATNDVDLDGNNTVTYYTTQAEALAGAGTPLTEPYNSTSTTIYAHIINAQGCADVAEVVLDVEVSPILQSAELSECDNGDGTAEFDLSTGNGSYYTSLADAQAETNPLAGDSYTGASTTLYLRVNATNDCYTIAEVILSVLPLPNIANAELAMCDDGDGTVDFDLSQATAAIDVEGTNTLTYHNAILDATTGNNHLGNLYSSAGETIFARVVTADGCYLIAELDLMVQPLPQAFSTEQSACADENGLVDFDLMASNGDIDPSGNHNITYHTSQADADANINVLGSPYSTTGTVLYARVEDANACYTTASLTLTVLATPTAAPHAMTGCLNEGFDLTDADSTVDPTGTNVVTYHEQLIDAEQNINPILANPYIGAGIIYARVESMNGCFAISEVQLSVNLISINNVEEELCADEASGIDLGSYQPQITNLTGTFTWYGNSDLTTPLIDISNITVGNGATFFAIFEATDLGCTDTATLSFIVLPATPTAELTPTAEVCSTDDGNGENMFNLQSLIINGDTTGTWNDTDETGMLAGSIFTATESMVGSTYAFTYTIEGAEGETGVCGNQSYEVNIMVNDCAPTCQPNICLPITITKLNE